VLRGQEVCAKLRLGVNRAGLKARCCARRERWGRIVVVCVFGLIGVDGMGWRFWEFEIWEIWRWRDFLPVRSMMEAIFYIYQFMCHTVNY
jgi:hypothetical protein